MATAAKQDVKSFRPQKKERIKSAGRRQRPRHVMLIAFLVLGLVGVALLHVWLRLQVVHMGYVLSTTSKLQNQLEQENRELKVVFFLIVAAGRAFQIQFLHG